MRTYLYDVEHAKSNGARSSYGKLFLICFLSIIVISAGFTISLFVFDEGAYPMELVILWVAAFAVTIVYTVKEGQLYYAATQTGYVVDEDSVTWLVQLFMKHKSGFGVVTDVYATVSNIKSAQRTQQKAKSEEVLIDYVKGTKAGKKYWNAFTGGEAKITPLYRLSVISEKKKYYQCSYENANGKTKKIKIVKAYPRFLD